ncbi:MAG: FAD-binding oxidoreductase [Acidimicrobiales bacterium]
MSGSAGSHAGFLSEVEAVVGARDCMTDQEVVASFTTDWTGRYSGDAVAVVRPANPEEVAAVLVAAGRHGVAVIPQGGNTGLVGGSVPRADQAESRAQVVLSLRRLAGVDQLDAVSRLLGAGAGTTLAAAQEAASRAGFHVGIDLAARDSATLGGMVATNAGGLHVFRYGPMRARLAGVEAVLADGTIVSHLSGLVKDNVGWDLGALLAGSEGTLAVVTRVMMRMEPLPRHRVAALVALPDASAAVDLVTGPLRSLPSLEAAELTLVDGMRLVCEHAALPAPIGLADGAAAWLTVEAASAHDPTDELAGALADGRVLAAAVAADPQTRTRLWAYRERHTEAVATLGIPHKLDVAVVPSRLPELLDALPFVVEEACPSARLIVWGHVADGNVHVNVIGPPADDYTIDDAVIQLVLGLGGSISAEHGIGVAKNRWLAAARPSGTLDLMSRVKLALDPASILNPGVLEPTQS